jgi:DNA-binding winged helix-turn-helix (wHTH) protein
MESLIGTVRNVGYRFTVAEASDEVKEKQQSASDAAAATSGA